MLLECSVVDENVELAECIESLLYRRPTKGSVGDIARQKNATPSLLFHRSLSFSRILVLIKVSDRDIGPFAGEEDGDGPTNSGVPPVMSAAMLWSFSEPR